MPEAPDFQLELAAGRRGARRIVGIDEVGRGPLAGPVVAAAVLLDPARLPAGLKLSIAAASIVAKVTRDRIMVDLAQQHPGYGWETNAGYPTRAHLAALEIWA
jgi:ribonuclease HII